jgi:glycogen debranching enzyme
MVGRSVGLAVELRADFADVLEVAQSRRQQAGESTVEPEGNGVAIRYLARRGELRSERGIRVRPLSGRLAVAPGPASGAVVASATVELPPRGRWSAALAFEPLVGRSWRAPIGEGAGWRRTRAEAAAWRRRRPRLSSTSATLERAWEQAAQDLYALRNRELEADAGEGWVPNAGVPVYTGLFGRDALTTGWQAGLLGGQLMRGALAIIGRLQATRDDAWLDAEPGKLIHELRRGPLAELRITAQAGYYGTQTTSAMFPVVVTELWHWTADDEQLRAHRGTAERALEWARLHGDLDGDGFLEYRQRSPVGIKNQGWKDSHEAIRYPDGGQVANPIATVEEQAFYFLGLCRMAEVCVALGDDAAAEPYLQRARRLRARFDDAYWMPAEGFYAMALDPAKRQVASVGSNPGHALGTGIVPPARAAQVAERLMADDMFSGWGVRTLSDRHPSFNPWAYHLGTVWPVENATFALGFKRYGLDDHAERLVSALLDAAAYLPGTRLPELIGGQTRRELEFPAAYPQANVPQAWSASATIQLAQIMLGIYPFAPLRLLALVRPRLPRGIDELTLTGIRVGPARVSLRFRRRADGSAAHEVIARRGPVIVVEAPPPDAPAPSGIGEQLGALLLAHAPGRLARAARLALGMIDEV